MRTPDYDTDFYAWTQAQAAALRDRKWMALDVDNLRETDLNGISRWV